MVRAYLGWAGLGHDACCQILMQYIFCSFSKKKFFFANIYAIACC
jgi:hypothetical protein